MREEVLTTGAIKMCKAPVKSSPPTNQHPAFYRLDAIPLSNQQCQSTEWKLKKENPFVKCITICTVQNIKKVNTNQVSQLTAVVPTQPVHLVLRG